MADSPLISVRVVNVDWYLSEESRLPVVRIFGSTPAGQRSCLHLHGALPYFMVRPMEDENSAICSQFEEPGSLNALLPQLEQALESAMSAASGRSGGSSFSPGTSSAGAGAGSGRGERPWGRNRQQVLARLEVVRGVPFYGYHGEEKLFVKVYVNNPALTGKVASVLQAGHVLSTRFQPYESHVPFLLQVFIDYNISGMSYVHLRNALFLQPLPELSSVPSTERQPSRDKPDPNDVANSLPLAGIFTTSTVPESLVANPLGQGAPGRSPAAATAHQQAADTAAGRIATAKELEPVILQGDTDEAAQDLLAGISMSQLFSQPSGTITTPSKAASSPRPEISTTPAVAASSPGKKTKTPSSQGGGGGGATRNRPVLRWWERQTTTELEVAGIVDDVINPTLLAAGRAAEEAGGGKAMAVASLRELWDEEKERSRLAGGGSQLSAPPGLELADSQDAWEPPEGLLTQEMKGAVEGVARNLLRRAGTPSREAGVSSSQPESSQPHSQPSTGSFELGGRSGEMERTASQDGLNLSQTSEAAAANQLPSPGAFCDDDDVDHGLLDIITALRGSQQSQGKEDELSSPMGRAYSQSPSGPISQQPVFTPESHADQAEAVAATQRKQEQDEAELGNRLALAAQSERHYDSDGSDGYLQSIQGVDLATDAAAAAAATAAGAAGIHTPVAAERPPWSSQRAASYPRSSPRSAGVAPARAATLPFWSQSSTKVATAGLSQRRGVGDRHGSSDEEEEEEEEEAEEEEAEDNGFGRMLSQLSSRSLDDVKGGVQAEVDREGMMPVTRRGSTLGALRTSQSPSFEPRPPSELVDIICSQVEVEQDQAVQNPTTTDLVGDPMDVIDEEEEEEEEEEGSMTTEAQRNTEWTRGPTQLQYDNDDDNEADDENDSGNEEETPTSQAADAGQEERRTDDAEAGANDSGGDKGPLRLRGGVGLPRTKAKSVRPTRSATAPEPTSSVPCPGSSSESSGGGGGGGGGASTASFKRPAPTLDPLTRRQAPLRPPGGLRRSVSTPGGKEWSGFKPPRPLSTAAKLTTVDQVASAGRADGARGDGDGDRAGCPSGDAVHRSHPREPLKSTTAAPESSAGNGGSNDEDNDSDTEEESSNTEERSQVVVPGWESQGRHPVEYRGGQLSFVSTAQLRVSPNLTRGLGRRTGSGTSDMESVNVGTPRKKQKVCEDEGGGSGGGADTESAVYHTAAGLLDGGGVRSGAGAAGSKPSGTLVAGDTVKAPGSENPYLEQESKNVDCLGTPTRVEVDDERQVQSSDDARKSPGAGGSTSTGTVDLEGRFRRANARLGLTTGKTTARDTPSPLQRRAFADSAHGSVNDTASPPMPSVRQEHGASPREACGDRDQFGVLADQVGDSTGRSSPTVDTPRAQHSLEAQATRGGREQEAEQAWGSAPGTAGRRHYDSGISSSPVSAPASATAAGLPTATPPLPPTSDWGRSPATPLSAHSDSSDMPPLGQPSPGLLTAATRDASTAGAAGGEGSGGGQRRLGDGGRASERSPSTPGGFFLSAGSGSTAGSPARGRCSGFTPPTPRSREGARAHGSGTVLLRPSERPPAPDPAVCAAAMSRLGVPQVVHTEAYYSRKDDVPERPREFAGNVFRISHKDDLQIFDTLPSRELLFAHHAAAATAAARGGATPTSPHRPHSGHSGSSSYSSYTPRSQPPEGVPTPRSTGGRSGHGLTASTPSQHTVTGTGGRAGESYDAGGGSGGLLWSGGDSHAEEPVALRGIEEWKEAAARRTSVSAGNRNRYNRRDPSHRVIELVPAISPPPCKDVAAWGRANPSTARSGRVVDDLDLPVLRSTRNALGVLAGGGEADLADHGSGEMSMVADPNTGKLVPVADLALPPLPRPAPKKESNDGAQRLESPPSSTPEAVSTNTPPVQTPGSVASTGNVANPRRNTHVTPDYSRNSHGKQWTQGPHRPTAKSQISPTTQTPSSCLSEEEGGRFAFGLGAAARGAATAAAAPAAAGSQTSGIGLSGGILGRDGNGGGRGEARGDRLTVLSMELHVQVGASRRPDPRRDSVHAVCWRVKDAFTSAERETVETTAGVIVLPLPLSTAAGRRQVAPGGGGGGGGAKSGDTLGGGDGGSGGGKEEEACLKCGERRNDEARAFCRFEGGGFLGQGCRRSGARAGAVSGSGRGAFCHGLGKDVEVLEVCSEEQVFRALVGVFCRHDPDFVVGWEVQGDSLGYVVERGLNMEPSMDMTRLLSRTPGRDSDKRNSRDEWGKTHGSGIWLTGRTVLNMWRLMRSELKLCSYTLQSVAEHVLRKRIPSFSLQLRSRWFSGRNVALRSRALADPLARASACLSIMDKLDLLGRTSEMARLFGIDFFSVLSRGSQYRVEAVMLRVLKPHNFVAVSPSRQQVAGQAAMESIPLVFEPQSRFYTSPVVVLDFQSLYPSMMIAYNLCYTTILGKFDPGNGGTTGNLGALPYPEASTSSALERAAASHHAWERRDEQRGQQHQQHPGRHGGGGSSGGRRGIGASPSPARGRTATSAGAGAAGAAVASSLPSGLSPVDEEKTPPVSASGGEGNNRTATSTATSAPYTPSFSYSSTHRSPAPGGSQSDERFPSPQADGTRHRARGKRDMWDPRCIHLAPNMAGFCHPSLRQGILPLMLREILETRVMIKGAMRRAEEAGQRVLARTLNARQFALKMISNVTYGYTAAGFSGRMPMAELADAIVESGRQTLIAAARTVDNHGTWQARVVYGDTDSLFIELKGRSLEEAHRIGKEMAATVSTSCPPDVVLKFEKVYLPCILASKKRYVGHMYESPKDLRPSFDAKGIETVRRDGCPLLVKMLEKVLRLLFTTRDLSQVKGYLYRQWTRILTDRAAVGDFIFAKEVRLGTYASDVYMPPSAIVASKAMANDPRAEPKYCERVPYVVVAGPVGARLMDLVVSPEQFLAEGSGLRLNGKYYITKVINPALDRALALLGVDVNAWYNEMPRPAPRVSHKVKKPSPNVFGGGGGGGGGSGGPWEEWGEFASGKSKGKGKGKAGGGKASVITNFFISDRCSLCGEQCARSVCENCASEPAANVAALSRLRESDLASQQLLEVCRQCTGHPPPPELFGPDSCGSLECPVFFERHRAMVRRQDARELCDALGLLSC